jgi:hypothetical protein
MDGTRVGQWQQSLRLRIPAAVAVTELGSLALLPPAGSQRVGRVRRGGTRVVRIRCGGQTSRGQRPALAAGVVSRPVWNATLSPARLQRGVAA